MPSKPLKPCNKPGCANLTNSKYCEEHNSLSVKPRTYNKDKDKTYDTKRGSAAARGYDHKWREYRKEFLKRNPKCKACGQHATVVDHIIPHKGNKGLFWTMFNHQALCASCHSKKTVKHDMGAW